MTEGYARHLFNIDVTAQENFRLNPGDEVLRTFTYRDRGTVHYVLTVLRKGDYEAEGEEGVKAE